MSTAKLWRSFAFEVLVATLAFSGILAAAVMVDYVVGWAERQGLPAWMITVAEWVEYLIFGVDVFVYSCFIVLVSWRMVEDLWQATR